MTQLLFVRCLILLKDIDGAYYYEAIGTASIPGSLSHVLCVTEEQLMTIYHYCGFYNVKRNCFYATILQDFIDGLNDPVGITRYKNPTTKICSLLMKIGQGFYLSKPLQQLNDQLQSPSHHLKKEERQLGGIGHPVQHGFVHNHGCERRLANSMECGGPTKGMTHIMHFTSGVFNRSTKLRPTLCNSGMFSEFRPNMTAFLVLFIIVGARCFSSSCIVIIVVVMVVRVA
jgi:hypothetical protein